MKEKIFIPNTSGVLKTMSTVFLLVLVAGSILSIVQEQTLSEWFEFLGLSIAYIIACTLIFLAIKTQKILITESHLILKQVGMTRHKIHFEHIKQVRKGKMTGSPIIEVFAKSGTYEKVCPIPYLPFTKDWDEILDIIKERSGHQVIGNMEIKRAKGELRTWREFN